MRGRAGEFGKREIQVGEASEEEEGRSDKTRSDWREHETRVTRARKEGKA